MIVGLREVSILSLCGLDSFAYQLCLENLRYVQGVTRNRKEIVSAAIDFSVHLLFLFCLRWPPIQRVSLYTRI